MRDRQELLDRLDAFRVARNEPITKLAGTAIGSD